MRREERLAPKKIQVSHCPNKREERRPLFCGERKGKRAQLRPHSPVRKGEERGGRTQAGQICDHRKGVHKKGTETLGGVTQNS